MGPLHLTLTTTICHMLGLKSLSYPCRNQSKEGWSIRPSTIQLMSGISTISIFAVNIFATSIFAT